MKSDQPTDTTSRLGGARADFVASLGRKVNDARGVLTHVERERGGAGERPPREELRRKVHALGASARLFHFASMVKALDAAEAALDRAAQAGTASLDDLGVVAHVLDDLPALAWGDPPQSKEESERKTESKSDPPEEATAARSAVLVGAAMLAEALTDPEIAAGAPLYECAQTDDVQAAIGMARKIAPDVIVIDGDLDASEELVEALLDDPLTEPVPIVVVGAFREGERSQAAAKFVALGVACALTKPITPEDLRRACDDAVEQRHEVTMRVTLGEPTLEQLGERLADEVRKALVQSVDGVARGVRVPLGEGTEVMSAMWGAIARVREVIVARTGGAVRFGHAGPEGAVALAPYMNPDVAATDRWAGRHRGPASEVRLHGRRVVVADDDPGVTWFIADLLRTAGCVVHEALDGNAALDLAYRTSPELVISDILMPGLDGFALTRALKRDVALRDVPVILLSWKEDLLQRVRELGANAAGYLRKESDSRAILARVRECLRGRSRVEARLRGDGEVRGRIDGITTRSLLELVCAMRPDSRLAVRDASFLYEMEIREGAPKRITRASSDGVFERGERVLAALLGVGAGRFTVAPSTSVLPNEDRDLAGSLASVIARPVAIARAARSVATGARTIDVQRVDLDDEALAALVFATPEPARSLVERIADGASPRAMLLSGEVDPGLLEEVLGDLGSRGVITAVYDSEGQEVLARAVATLLAPEPILRAAPAPLSASMLRVSAPPPRPGPKDPLDEAPPDLTPSSLADALMRELGEAPVPQSAQSRSSNPPPIIEPSELRPRSNPPSVKARSVPPPEAIVPGAEDAPPREAAGDQTEVDAPVAPKDESSALDDEASAKPEVSIPIEISVSAPAVEPRTPMEAVASDDAGVEPPRKASRWPWAAAIGVAAIGIAFGVQAVRAPQDPAAAAGPAPDPAALAPVSTGQPVATNAKGVTYDALPAGFVVSPGQGLLEVKAAPASLVRVDGVDRASGAGLVRLPLTAGPHEVGAAHGADGPSRTVEVRAGRAARVELSVP
jgi:CheY-like chemotaxis protein